MVSGDTWGHLWCCNAHCIAVCTSARVVYRPAWQETCVWLCEAVCGLVVVSSNVLNWIVWIVCCRLRNWGTSRDSSTINLAVVIVKKLLCVQRSEAASPLWRFDTDVAFLLLYVLSSFVDTETKIKTFFSFTVLLCKHVITWDIRIRDGVFLAVGTPILFVLELV